MKSDFIVEVTIKDGCGKQYTPKIDKFVGTPEDVIRILSKKYSSKKKMKNLFEWLYQPLNITNKEIQKRVR